MCVPTTILGSADALSIRPIEGPGMSGTDMVEWQDGSVKNQ